MCLSQTVFSFHRLFLHVTDSCSLSQKLFVSQRKYVSVTDSMCLSQIVCVCLSQSFLSETVCVFNRLTVSATDSRCLSQTVFFFRRLFLTICVCLSQIVCVCLSQSVLSQTVCVCPRQSVLSQTVCVCHRNVFPPHQFESLSNTLLDLYWPDVLPIYTGFLQDLSMIFQFVQDLNLIRTNFVDLCPATSSPPNKKIWTTILIGREIQCLPYAEFLFTWFAL